MFVTRRDRVSLFWQSIRNHIYDLIVPPSASEHRKLVERAVVGLLRIAIRLLRRDEMASQVFQQFCYDCCDWLISRSMLYVYDRVAMLRCCHRCKCC